MTQRKIAAERAGVSADRPAVNVRRFYANTYWHRPLPAFLFNDRGPFFLDMKHDDEPILRQTDVG